MNPKAKPSRTLESAKLGMIALMVLSVEVLICMLWRPEAMEPLGDVIATLAIAIASVATGGTLSLGGRHWGAKEKSSFAHSEKDQ